MGAEPKFKLNLKALSSQNNQKSDIVPPSKKDETTQVGDTTPNLKIDSPLKTKEEGVLENSDISVGDEQKVEKVQKENIKSHNISFADIKNQIKKKNSSKQTDIEEIDTTDSVVALPDNTGVTEKNGNLKIEDGVENDNNFENLKAKTIGTSAINTNTNESKAKDGKTEDNTTEITLNEDKEAHKEKVEIENTEKIKVTGTEKEEKKKEVISKNGKDKEFLAETDQITTGKIPVSEDATLQEEDLSDKKIAEKVHFSNYESHFKKESTNFLKKFQKFKYAPSTRVGLVIGLVSLTVIVITSLMVVFPEKHSFHIYKASILEMIPKSAETNIVEVQSTIPTKTIPEEMIIPEVVIDDFDTGNTEKQSHINDQITSQEKSKEILRQHLLNKYK